MRSSSSFTAGVVITVIWTKCRAASWRREAVSAPCNCSVRHGCRGQNAWRDPPPHPNPCMTSLNSYSAFCFDDSAFQDGTSRSSRNVIQSGVAAHKSEDYVPTDIKIFEGR